MPSSADYATVVPKASIRPAIGWREWVALPDLGIPWLKAKVDTGARTSALNAVDVTVEEAATGSVVHFTIHPWQRTMSSTVRVSADLVEYRKIKSSTGRITKRPVIETSVVVAGTLQTVELTLVDRSDMGFRMLLGRQAMRGRYVVDPGLSYRGGRPDRDTLRANRGR